MGRQILETRQDRVTGTSHQQVYGRSLIRRLLEAHYWPFTSKRIAHYVTCLQFKTWIGSFHLVTKFDTEMLKFCEKVVSRRWSWSICIHLNIAWGFIAALLYFADVTLPYTYSAFAIHHVRWQRGLPGKCGGSAHATESLVHSRLALSSLHY